MEIIIINENDTISKESTHEPTNEKDLLNLFKQYSDFSQPTLDWLGANYTIVISDASIQGTSTTNHISVQEQPAIAQLGAKANMSVISQKILTLLPQNQNY